MLQIIKSNAAVITYSFYILMVVTLCGCVTNSKDHIGEGPFKLVGLKNTEVYAINMETDKTIVLSGNGVYIKEDNKLKSFGLKGLPVIDIVQTGAEEYLAGVFTLNIGTGEKTLYRWDGTNWDLYMGNYGGEEGKFTRVSSLAVHPNSNNTNLVAGAANVSLSIDSGQSWKLIYNQWDNLGLTYFLSFQPGYSDTIWVGGSNAIFQPILVRTLDGGKNWEYIKTIEFTESENYDILFDSNDQDHITVAMSGFVRATNDFGETWETVLTGPYGFTTFAKSALDPQTIYVSGYTREETFFLFVSRDNGQNWEEVVLEGVPENIYVNDIVTIMEEGQEVLYFGTNKGLYSYTVEN